MISQNYDNPFEIMPEPDGAGTNTNKRTTIIKVIGVGGGGGNAVKHMYNMGINDVDYIVCNTDRQCLQNSPIPIKIELGSSGLGAGADPEVARQAALESEEKIKEAIKGSHMVFITAGMGGGTGTGASPVIADIARKMNILTVGIVTFPFNFERGDKAEMAEKGIKELRQNVDALIVIKNESLKNYFPELKLSNAFSKADDVLLIAAKSIAETITLDSIINVDFKDVSAILKDSGTAIIGSGLGEGENRASMALQQAINSPLLDNNSVYGAKKILLFISYSKEYDIDFKEFSAITDELESQICKTCEKFIWGYGFDDKLGEQIRVTIIATQLNNQPIEISRQSLDETKTPPQKEDSDENIFTETTAPDKESDTPRRPNNAQLQHMSEKETDDYLQTPSIFRERSQNADAPQKDDNNECSNCKINGDNIEHRPPYLYNAVD